MKKTAKIESENNFCPLIGSNYIMISFSCFYNYDKTYFSRNQAPD